MCVPKSPIDNKSSLVQVMACRLFGTKPFPEPIVTHFTDTYIVIGFQWVNSSPPSTAYMRWWIGSAEVQMMSCRLFGAKPLSEPMLDIIVDWTLRNKVQWNLNRNSYISFKKMHMKLSSAKWRPFCPGGDELIDITMGHPWIKQPPPQSNQNHQAYVCGRVSVR